MNGRATTRSWRAEPRLASRCGALFRVPGEDDFTPVLFLSAGLDQGVWDVTLDGRSVGRINACRSEPHHGFPPNWANNDWLGGIIAWS